MADSHLVNIIVNWIEKNKNGPGNFVAQIDRITDANKKLDEQQQKQIATNNKIIEQEREKGDAYSKEANNQRKKRAETEKTAASERSYLQAIEKEMKLNDEKLKQDREDAENKRQNITALQKIIKEKEKEEKVDKKAVAESKERLRVNREERDSLNREISSLRQRNNFIKDDIENSHKRIQAIDQENTSVRKILATQTEYAQGLRDEKKEKIEANKEAVKRVHEIDAESAALSRATAGQKDHLDGLEEERHTNVELIKQNQTRLTEINDETRLLRKRNTEINRSTSTLARGLSSLTTESKKFGSAFTQAGKDIEKDTGIFNRLAQSGKEARQDFDGLFRAFRGAIFASILAGIQPLLSAVTALGGQLIALGGSAIYAGSAIGGALIAGFTQALPVIGIFMAVMQRLQIIMQAVNENFLVQKQGANRSSTALAANKQAAQQTADAQRSLADAQRGVDAAQRQLTQSEVALNQARQDAQRQVQDLMFAERDEELQLKGSILSRKEAEQQLQDAIQNGAAPQELAQLRLQVQQANQDVKEQRVSAQRASQDADKARQKGLRAIDSFVSAQRAVADAHRGVAQAERQLTQAQIKLNRAQTDAVTAAKDQSTTQSYLKYFLQQLTPAEHALYEEMIKVRNFFKNQFTDITDPIIKGLTSGIKRGLDFLRRPAIFNGLKSLSQTLADQLGRITKFITSPGMEKFWTFTLREARKNLPEITQAFIVVGRIFKNIAEAAAPVLSKFLHFIVNQLKDFNKEVSNKDALTNFFTIGFKFFRAWFNVLKATLNLAGALMGVSKSSAFQTLHSFTDTLNNAAAYIRDNGKAARDFFNETADALSTLGKGVVDLGRAMVQIFDAGTISDFVSVLENFLLPALGQAVSLTGDFIKALNFFANLPVIGFLLSNFIKWGIALTAVLKTTQILTGLVAGKLYQAYKAVLATSIGERLVEQWKKVEAAIAAAIGQLGIFQRKQAVGGLTPAAASTLENQSGVLASRATPAATAVESEATTAESAVSTGFLSKAKSIGSSFGTLLVTGMKAILPTALGALAIFDIFSSALSGDMKDAGKKLGFSLVGGIIGFIAGGPAGAAIGAGIGDLLSHVFDGSSKAISTQQKLANATRAVANAFRSEHAALLELKGANLSESEARVAHREAIVAENQAQLAYNKAVDKFGKDSHQAKVAHLALRDAQNATKRSVLDLRDSQKSANKANKDAIDTIQKLAERIHHEETVLSDAKTQNRDFIRERKQAISDFFTAPGGPGSPQALAALGQIRQLTDEINTNKAAIDKTSAALDDNRQKYSNQRQELLKNIDSNSALNDKLVKIETTLHQYTVGLGDASDGHAHLQRETDTTSGKSKDFAHQAEGTRSHVGNLKGTLDSTGKQAHELGRLIGLVTNNVLNKFGVKKLTFDLPEAKTIPDQAAGAVGSGGTLTGGGFQKGGWFGDPSQRSSDDRLIGVAGGEAILTGWHQRVANTALGAAKAMGLSPYGSLGEMFGKDRREHRTAPKGYDRGGYAWPFGGGAHYTPGGYHGVRVDEGVDFYGSGPVYAMGDGRVVSGNWGFPGVAGLRLDLSGGTPKGPGISPASSHIYMYEGVQALKTGIVKAGEVIGKMVGSSNEVGFSTASGQPIAQLFGALPADHHSQAGEAMWNFLQAIKGNKVIGAAGGAAAELLKRIKIKGPDGPLKDMLQGSADSMRKAANKFLSKKERKAGAAIGTGGFITAGASGNVLKEMYQILSKAGLNKTAIAAIMGNSYGESSWNPTPPGSSGGLFGFLVGEKSPAALQAYAKAHKVRPYDVATQVNFMLSTLPTSMRNAMNNMSLDEATIYFLRNWEGAYPQGLSNRLYGAHKAASMGYGKGGKIPEFDSGGIIPGKRGSPQLVVGHGGETVLPTHKNSFQTGGVVAQAFKDFADPGDAFKAFYKAFDDLEKKGHIKDALDALNNLLRDGGTFDDIAAAIEQFTTFIARKTAEWTYKIHKGIVVQAHTNLKGAERNLDDLQKEYKKLAREQGDVNKTIRRIQQKLKDADKKQREDLKASLNKLLGKAGDLQDLINQNLSDQFDAQAAVLQAEQDRFQQKLDKKDLQLQILQAKAGLTGNVNVGAQTKILRQEGHILEDQRKDLQKDLRDARKSGDKEQQRALQQQLLENKLALLQNTQAIKDLKGTNQKIIDFNSTAWDLWRVAIFNAQGGIIPHGAPIPSLQTGGHVVKTGLVKLHAGEVVTNPEHGNGTMNINITEPMEVADPVALSNAIAFKMKTKRW